MIVLPYMITYVTKDRERAEGMPESQAYSILSGKVESTLELLQNTNLPKGSNIIVFKNNSQIEELAKKQGWKLLNPDAELSEKIENKISQVEWLGELVHLLPAHEILITKDIKWKKKLFIIQWAHSHTGDGTFLIAKESELENLRSKFPDRQARVTEYVQGPMFTVNIVVGSEKILIGNPSYQITGLAPFTDNPFSTIGNDWSLPSTILTEKNTEELNTMAVLLGQKMQKEKWRGLFGIDVIYDALRDRLFLIEINARQPASATYESQLQKTIRETGIVGMTTFEAHIAALVDKPLTSLIGINDGAQIIHRVTEKIKKVAPTRLENSGYKVIIYKNKKINSDLARIQSKQGIMESHNRFNERGKEIESMIL